jgi:WD40 repeat protein
LTPFLSSFSFILKAFLRSVGPTFLKRNFTKNINSLGLLKGHSNTVFNVLLSWDDSLLFSGSSDQSIIIWDTATSKQKAQLLGHTGSVYTLKLSITKKHIYSGSYDNLIIRWDIETHKIVEKFKGFYTYLSSMVFTKYEDVIYTLDADDSSYIK